MNVELAQKAGFCFGVKRAVDMVYNQVKTGEKVYTFGPIIHNEEVVLDLKKKGVLVIETLEELDSIEEGTVIIRSHGVSRKIQEKMEQKGLQVIDATCPFVKKIHRIVTKEDEAHRNIVIIGNKNHPEVEGIQGWSKGNVVVIENVQEAQDYEPQEGNQVCIVAQTTFNYKKFQELVEILRKKSYDILAMNTICNATQERQKEARQIAIKSDAMIVIGGKNSSNTQKLYEICKKECDITYYIQTLDDLDLSKIRSFRSVGITAGASTPNNIIEEVQMHVRNEF